MQIKKQNKQKIEYILKLKFQRNPESVKASFLAVFMENVYPLMFLAKLRNADHMNVNLWKVIFNIDNYLGCNCKYDNKFKKTDSKFFTLITNF